MDSQTGRVVVGFDGTEHSGAALDWAAEEARRRRLPLTVLTVVHNVRVGAAAAAVVPEALGRLGWPELFEREGGRLAEQGAQRARRTAPSVDITAVTHFAQVPDSLITASRDAELLVLGLPNHGATSGPVLGSVALDVSAHALCPCVVVRGDSTQQPGPDCPIVVGVDGSPGSDAAVRYAARVAAETDAPLHLIAAYRTQPSRSWSGALRANARGRGEVNLRARARQAAKELTRAARRLGLDLYPGLKVTEQVLEGSTVPVLTTAAHRAALLVVGSRGLGGFAGRMLGSVSNGAIHDAPCPVAILRSG